MPSIGNERCGITPVELVQLKALMDRTHGRPEIAIGLIDGPVLLDHPDFARQSIRFVPGTLSRVCGLTSSGACLHGTFVAGILCARRGSVAPAICPGCTLIVRPIFLEKNPDGGGMPSSTPTELAEAIVDCVDAGAAVLNLSAVLTRTSSDDSRLNEALNYAASQGVIAVAAAGNHGTLESSVITRHPAVIPVVACDCWGRPLPGSNLGSSSGRRGLMAPGERVVSLGTNGTPLVFGGTSVAAPFVTGTIALLWSEYPDAGAATIRLAVTQADARQRRTITPPLVNARAAYQAMDSLRIRS